LPSTPGERLCDGRTNSSNFPTTAAVPADEPGGRRLATSRLITAPDPKLHHAVAGAPRRRRPPRETATRRRSTTTTRRRCVDGDTTARRRHLRRRAASTSPRHQGPHSVANAIASGARRFSTRPRRPKSVRPGRSSAQLPQGHDRVEPSHGGDARSPRRIEKTRGTDCREGRAAVRTRRCGRRRSVGEGSLADAGWCAVDTCSLSTSKRAPARSRSGMHGHSRPAGLASTRGRTRSGVRSTPGALTPTRPERTRAEKDTQQGQATSGKARRLYARQSVALAKCWEAVSAARRPGAAGGGRQGAAAIAKARVEEGREPSDKAWRGKPRQRCAAALTTSRRPPIGLSPDLCRGGPAGSTLASERSARCGSRHLRRRSERNSGYDLRSARGGSWSAVVSHGVRALGRRALGRRSTTTAGPLSGRRTAALEAAKERICGFQRAPSRAT